MEQSEKSEKKLHTKRLGRELAMQYFFQCELSGEAPNERLWEVFIEQAADTHELSDNRYARKSREYAETLIYVIKDKMSEIDAMIKRFADNWDWDRLSLVDKNIMRVAVAEMIAIGSVPPIVSINEAVEIARDYSGEGAGNFINGVLNAVKDQLPRSSREVATDL